MKNLCKSKIFLSLILAVLALNIVSCGGKGTPQSLSPSVADYYAKTQAFIEDLQTEGLDLSKSDAFANETLKAFANDTTTLTADDKAALREQVKEIERILIETIRKENPALSDEQIEKGRQAMDTQAENAVEGSLTLGEFVVAFYD